MHVFLIVEINHTADLINPNNPNNVKWYYGDFLNHSLLKRQHNPDYLKRGNIIIADSPNDRILEINKTTKEVIWSYSGGLRWPRDADELDNGNILITDSFNCRVFQVEKNTKRIVWFFLNDLIIPYESDILNNGAILISNEYGGYRPKINSGWVTWYGNSEIFVYEIASATLTQVTTGGGNEPFSYIDDGWVTWVRSELSVSATNQTKGLS